MADRLERVELLMRMAADIRADNNEWTSQVCREGAERFKRVCEYLVMLEREYGAMAQEKDRLAVYGPPKVVTQGSQQSRAPTPEQRRQVEGH